MIDSGEARAGRHAPDGRVSPVHHRRRLGPEAHERQGHPGRVREPRRRAHREGHPALQELHARRGTVSFIVHISTYCCLSFICMYGAYISCGKWLVGGVELVVFLSLLEGLLVLHLVCICGSGVVRRFSSFFLNLTTRSLGQQQHVKTWYSASYLSTFH